MPARSTCVPPSPTPRTPLRPRSATRSASAPSPRWRGASASPRRSRRTLRWCSARRTRACAEISDKGQSIEPYGIIKVTTSNGQALYQHQPERSTQLVADYVAAGMTDLLQTAVNTGTGRAAQIGRPVAGKTGTTSSNKDGWFLGFSSGITTGVWMGRDDAKPVGGLWGGTSPARAFSDYMRFAVKN